MRIGKRIFPYPIVNNDKTYSCFDNAEYSLEYEQTIDNENLVLKNLHYALNSEYLSKLIESGDLCVTLIVECSSTVYREAFEISCLEKDLSIPIKNLRGKVELSCFIWASHDFVYNSNEFQEEYNGYSFSIEKYSIIGADDGFTTRIEYDENKDKKITSIFSIISNSEQLDCQSTMDITPKKILISLPSKEFNIYDALKTNEYFQNIFFSIIAIPAFASALSKIINKEFDEIELEYPWFISVEKAYERVYNKKLTADIIRQNDFDPYIIAQALLNYGTVNAIDDIYKMSFERTKGLGGEEDE